MVWEFFEGAALGEVEVVWGTCFASLRTRS